MHCSVILKGAEWLETGGRRLVTGVKSSRVCCAGNVTANVRRRNEKGKHSRVKQTKLEN